MEYLNQYCFSPQNLSRSFHRLTSIQVCLVVICSSLIAITLVWKVQFQQFKPFYIACNELIPMEHFNQRVFALNICHDCFID